MHACVHYVCLSVCVYTHVCIYMYVCAHVCMHVYLDGLDNQGMAVAYRAHVVDAIGVLVAFFVKEILSAPLPAYHGNTISLHCYYLKNFNVVSIRYHISGSNISACNVAALSDYNSS